MSGMVTDTPLGNYLSPKFAVRPCPEKNGRGVFAVAAVEPGEVVAVFGGRVVDLETALAYPPSQQNYIMQVEEGLYLAPLERVDPAELVNHGCRPNCGLQGQITLVAMRRIAPDEEATFDYAVMDSTPFMEFDCLCGSPACRKRVRADDWQRPDVQAVNRGYFSPYLQRRIDLLSGPAVTLAVGG